VPRSGDASTGLRALVVDDDPVIRELAAEAVRGVGFAGVEEAEDGLEALERAQHEAFDLILLDLKMPGLDGFQACERLRALPATEDVPILIATAWTDEQTIDRAFDVGATDFVKKPIDWQLFQYRVRFIVAAHSAFRDLRHTLTDLARSRQRLTNAQRMARIGYYELDPVEQTMLWSEQLRTILQARTHRETETTSAFLERVHPEDRAAVEKVFSMKRGETSWKLEHRIWTPQGERIVWHQAELRHDDAGTRLEGTIQDVTEQRRSEAHIRFLAYHDPLTLLPNRNHLREVLTRVLQRAERAHETVGLVCIDLEHFHRINDTLGHTMGDELLRQAARRLQESVRATDVMGRSALSDADVSRLGGDEFTVILPSATAQEAREAATRLLAVFDAPFQMADRTLHLGARAGVAVSSPSLASAEALLQAADLAVAWTKRGNSGPICFFDRSMNQEAERRFELETAMRGALERGEFFLVYQPVLDVRRQSVERVEALMRWRHPVFGSRSPGEYIPVAEEMGLVVALDRWVLHEACRQARAWLDSGLPPVRVAVNVSGVTIRHGGLAEVVASALEQSGLPGHLLELEITESAVLGDLEAATATLAPVRELGVLLALDDVGMGYASLNYMVRLPVSCMKIDRSFVRDIGVEQGAARIIPALIGMAERLGIEVIAEGVETEEQELFLRGEGCSLLQGFRFFRPMDPDRVAEHVRDGASSEGTCR
jgi:diguanylate cyclase (GGDEF)-like protein